MRMDSVTVAFELMRLELEAEVESLNNGGAKHFCESAYEEANALIQKGKALKAFCLKGIALEEEWRDAFAEGDAQVKNAPKSTLLLSKYYLPPKHLEQAFSSAFPMERSFRKKGQAIHWSRFYRRSA
jgi:hypothetical protein